MDIIIVSNKFFATELLANVIRKLLPKSKVATCYRDYNFEKYMAVSTRPELVISNGKCKTRDDSGESVDIYYDVPREYARVKSVTFLPFTLLRPLIWAHRLFGVKKSQFV